MIIINYPSVISVVLFAFIASFDPAYCASEWSQWYNTDRPSGTGDWECTGSCFASRGHGTLCPNRIAAECMRVKTGEIFTTATAGNMPNVFVNDCTPSHGVNCMNLRNTEIGRPRCEDYAIRFLCVKEATCTSWGDPHVTSFDGKMFDFQGNCVYALCRDCFSGNFSIEIDQKLTHPGSLVAVSRAFSIQFHSLRIELHQNQQLYINGVQTSQPYVNVVGPGLNVSTSGSTITVTFGNGLVFKWGNNHNARITVPGRYIGKLCGLCGDFNGDPNNDFTAPDSTLYNTSTPFGNSWQIKGAPGQPATCQPVQNDDTPLNTCHLLGEDEVSIARSTCTDIIERLSPCISNAREHVAICMTELCDCGVTKPLCACTTLDALVTNICGSCCNPSVVQALNQENDCVGFCTYNGKAYKDDDIWYDGCSKCKCQASIVTCDKTTCAGLCESCTYNNGVYLFGDSDDCTAFRQCTSPAQVNPMRRYCGWGQFWNENVLTCTRARYTKCSNDPCRANGLVGWKHSSVCTAYWVCDQGRTVGLRCCSTPGFSWQNDQCASDSSCADKCPPTGPREADCDLTSVAGDPTKFRQLLSSGQWTVIDCASGTAFVQKACKCTGTARISSKDCTHDLYIPFDYNPKDVLLRVGVTNGGGVTLVRGVPGGTGRGVGRFTANPQSYLSLPRWAHSYFGDELMIQLRFLEAGSGQGLLETLVTNGDCGEERSVCVTFDRKAGQVHGSIVTSKSGAVVVSVSSDANVWNDVIFVYNGSDLQLKVNGRRVSSKAQGDILRRKAALKIGAGCGEGHFEGYIDELYVFDTCIDSDD